VAIFFPEGGSFIGSSPVRHHRRPSRGRHRYFLRHHSCGVSAVLP
jgi:hypothetical protein